MSQENKKNDFSHYTRQQAVTALADMKKKRERLKYSYDNECSRRQRLYCKMMDIMGDTELFKFDTMDYISQPPFDTPSERALAYSMIEAAVKDVGNAEFYKKNRKCSKIHDEYQACIKFCSELKDAIKEMDRYISQLREITK